MRAWRPGLGVALVAVAAVPALVLALAGIDAYRRGGELVAARLDLQRRRAGEVAVERVRRALLPGSAEAAEVLALAAADDADPADLAAALEPGAPSRTGGRALDLLLVDAGGALVYPPRPLASARAPDPPADPATFPPAIAERLAAAAGLEHRSRDPAAAARAYADAAALPEAPASARALALLGALRCHKQAGALAAVGPLAEALVADHAAAAGPGGAPLALYAALEAAVALDLEPRARLLAKAAEALAAAAGTLDAEATGLLAERLAEAGRALAAEALLAAAEVRRAADPARARLAAALAATAEGARRRDLVLVYERSLAPLLAAPGELIAPLPEGGRWVAAALLDGGRRAVRLWPEADARAVVAAALAPVAAEHGVELALADGGPTALAPLPGGRLAIRVADAGAGALARSERRRLAVGAGLLAGALVTVVLASLYAVRAIRREAEAARQRTAFVAAVTHQLRTPLTAIIAHAELLREGTGTPAGVAAGMGMGVGAGMGVAARAPAAPAGSAAVVLGQAARLLQLVENVLSLARLERGAEALRPARQPVDDLIRDTAEALRGLVEPDGLRLDVDVDPALGEAVIDREAVRQALLNLIDNARLHAAGGCEIAVRAQRRAGRLRVEVLDRGPGVPGAVRDRLGQRFAPGAGPRSASGLGLAIAWEVAEAHGGRLEIADREGGGAAIALDLPVAGALP